MTLQTDCMYCFSLNKKRKTDPPLLFTAEATLGVQSSSSSSSLKALNHFDRHQETFSFAKPSGKVVKHAYSLYGDKQSIFANT